MTLRTPSLPVVHASAADAHRPSEAANDAVGREAAYATQVFGQPGIVRGLRGGEAVLKAARAAYLGAEYSGDHDRRPPPGLLRRTRL